MAQTSLRINRARSREAGFANGFKTTRALVEPTAILIAEALGKIGIKVTLDKIPGANWRTTLR
jgi:peptide/nickel transport system substrate-binding protein